MGAPNQRSDLTEAISQPTYPFRFRINRFASDHLLGLLLDFCWDSSASSSVLSQTMFRSAVRGLGLLRAYEAVARAGARGGSVPAPLAAAAAASAEVPREAEALLGGRRRAHGAPPVQQQTKSPSLRDRGLPLAPRLFSSSASRQSTKIVPFPLAQTGEGIAECEIIKWFIGVGDTVEQFDPICEVQSDKANIEITSRHAGTVRTICFEEGDIAEVGATLIEIEVAEEVGGDDVAEDAPRSGDEAGEAETREDAASLAPAPAQPEPAQKSAVLASPAVRRVARETGVDLSAVTGTGPRGRILKENVLEHGKDAASAVAPPKPSPPASRPREEDQEDLVLPLKGYTRAMFYSMQKALEVPHFGFHEELVVDNLMHLKAACKPEFERKLASDALHERRQDGAHSHPVLVDYTKAKLTMMPFLFKALSLALEDFPVINSSVDPEGKAIVQHARHNIGCAMNTPFGLVVPNVKNVAKKSVMDIAMDLYRLQVLAQSNHLSPEDINGGTITVSNIGTIAGTYASPLIHVPEVAIVALGRAEYLPRYAEDGGGGEPKLKRTPVMPLSWNADHRVVDGATLASFCKVWKSYLESPDKMILHLC